MKMTRNGTTPSQERRRTGSPGRCGSTDSSGGRSSCLARLARADHGHDGGHGAGDHGITMQIGSSTPNLHKLLVERSKMSLNRVKNQPRFLGEGRSNTLHSAGASVSALIDENTVAVAIVMENC